MDDAHTDPRANGTINVAHVPIVVGNARLAAAEVRIAAEMIAREAGGGPLHAAAHTLALHATRLGMWANALSALPASPAPPPLEIVATGGRWTRARWRAAWRAFWLVWRA